MGWIVSKGEHPPAYLITASIPISGSVKFEWFYKRGSAHIFTNEAAAEAVAFLCGGIYEDRDGL